MPVLEYACPAGHTKDILYKTFSDAAEAVPEIVCPTCGDVASRVLFPRTLEPHFYGNPDGFHKPSPTLRYNTKTVSKTDGNKYSAG